jgi:probable HAF family extracellular repeat protein
MYTIVNIGTLGGSSSTALGINDSGEVVGTATLSGDTTSHAFLYSNGQIQDLGSLGGTNANANAINFSGEIVGTSTTSPTMQQSYAFTYSNGSMQSLASPLQPQISDAFSINSSGLIVGTWVGGPAVYSNGYWSLLVNDTYKYGQGFAVNSSGQATGYLSIADSSEYYQAFIWTSSSFKYLGTLGGNTSDGRAINSSGEVVGESLLASNATTDAFLYDGTMHDLGTLGGNDATAYGINDSGVIVGRSNVIGSPGFQAFVYSNGQMTNLNTLIPSNSGWTLNEALGINNSGQIVGAGTYDGESLAFLLDPVPEPASCSVLIGAVAILLSRRRDARSARQ